jgi:hypothetical protein
MKAALRAVSPLAQYMPFEKQEADRMNTIMQDQRNDGSSIVMSLIV